MNTDERSRVLIVFGSVLIWKRHDPAGKSDKGETDPAGADAETALSLYEQGKKPKKLVV